MIEVLLRRRVAWWLLATYVVLLLAVVFEPFPHAANDSIDLAWRPIRQTALRGVISPETVGFALNVVLFAPVAFLGSIVARRITWEQWVGFGLLASMTIEVVQELLLPDRTSSLWDVLANTLGAAVGALAARRLISRATSPAAAESRTDAVR